MYIGLYVILWAAWIGFCRTRQTCPTGPTPNTHKLMQLRECPGSIITPSPLII